MIHTIQQNMSATHIHESRSHTTASHPDQNKICQWYCCLCGQCFGQIYYKNHYDTLNDDSDGPNDSMTGNDLVNRLKYYSKMAYNQIDRRDEDYTVENTDYFERLPIQSSGLTSPGTISLELARKRNGYTYGQRGASSMGHPNYTRADMDGVDAKTTVEGGEAAEDGDKDSFYSNKPTRVSSDVVLKIPTRFTCHRCDHMMCPYCPKIRLKDLDNDDA